MKFWIPSFKWQLVNWLKRYDSKINWTAKSKKQLLAIYINIRKKGGYVNEKTCSIISIHSNSLINGISFDKMWVDEFRSSTDPSR